MFSPLSVSRISQKSKTDSDGIWWTGWVCDKAEQIWFWWRSEIGIRDLKIKFPRHSSPFIEMTKMICSKTPTFTGNTLLKKAVNVRTWFMSLWKILIEAFLFFWVWLSIQTLSKRSIISITELHVSVNFTALEGVTYWAHTINFSLLLCFIITVVFARQKSCAISVR